MKPKGYRRDKGRLKKKYRQVAAALAGMVAISAGAAALPAATAHAAANPNANTPPAETQKVGKTTRSEAPENYQKVLEVRATAYAPGPQDNDQWGTKTHLGTEVRPGIIAVDPHIIPLGSRVFIQYPDGHGEYARAEDTGGAIKGNRIDVAKATVREAENFGIQHVKVFVVSTPDTAKA